MDRRRFLQAGAAIAGGALASSPVRAQPRPVYADMHSHMSFSPGVRSYRDFMAKGNMLLVAEKVVPDSPWIKAVGNRLMARDASPGETRKHFDQRFARVRERARLEKLPTVTSVESLDRLVAEATPGLVVGSEGADFLEGDLGYLDRVRAEGLVHVQLVHYRISDVGDISTQSPRHGGLTTFGKEVVRACNRLGILVDVAHCSGAGIEHALEASSKPMVYSHGHVSASAPSPLQDGPTARAIHAPLAKRLAEKGGVIGLWPLWTQYADLEMYTNELARMVEAYGAQHVGIGTDMFGLFPRSTVPSYAEYALLPDYLAKRGLKPDEIAAVLGGNYIRVLREALSA
jgi:membrane dipeptidase